MKWYHYIGTLALAFAGYCAVFPVSTEEPVAGKVDIVAKPIPVNEEPLFAEVDAQGNVVRVIVADQKFIDSGAVGDPKNWIQTSSKGTIRKNYAGKGATYDKNRDAFIPRKPEGALVLDETKALWVEPVVIKTSIATTTR